MFARLSRPASAAIAAFAAAGALMVPAAAGAQSYGYVPGYGGPAYDQPYAYDQGRSYDYGAQRYYDPCARERQGRTGAGALVGGGLGAVVGSQLAARGRRTEGSILGGVLGAVVGGSVGRGSSDRCVSNSYSRPVYNSSAYGQSTYYDENGYGPYASPPSSYGQDDYGYDRRDDYAYDRDGQPASSPDSYPVQDRGYQNTDECRLAESRISLPDGRSEVRYVRTCPDQTGRYRVVD